MRLKLTESLKETEVFLQSKDLINKVNNLTTKDSEDIVDFVIEETIEYLTRESQDEYAESNLPMKSKTIVLSVDGNDFEAVATNHYVVEFNGMYYDYSATDFANIFGITKKDTPVVQPVLTSEKAVTQSVSTVKHYALLSNNKE